MVAAGRECNLHRAKKVGVEVGGHPMECRKVGRFVAEPKVMRLVVQRGFPKVLAVVAAVVAAEGPIPQRLWEILCNRVSSLGGDEGLWEVSG